VKFEELLGFDEGIFWFGVIVGIIHSVPYMLIMARSIKEIVAAM